MTLPVSFRTTIPALLILALAGGCDRQVAQPGQGANTAAPASPAPADAPSDSKKAALEPVGAIDRTHKGEAAPAISFQAPDGAPTSVAKFAGKPLLLNLWATWCGPCIAEMPTLDALAARMTVVAVSQDLDGAAKVTPFFAAKGLKTLKPYLDPQVALSTTYQASLPTSILYDSRGNEVWRVAGGMDWTGPAAAKLLAEAR